MKHYEKLVEIGCFSRSKLANELNCPEATASTIISQYLKKGYIERVRHDMYVTISIETKQPILSRYQIGANIFPDACISHHSAFELYGYANQVFYQVYVASKSRFKDFSYNGISYFRVAKKEGIKSAYINDILVTEIEQTVVDSIHFMRKISGLEEVVRCILLVPSLNEDKLLLALKVYNNGFLYQKCGYILESLNDTLDLSNNFFEKCAENISNAKRYLMSEQEELTYQQRWKLYAPKSLKILTNKGVNDYDAI